MSIKANFPEGVGEIIVHGLHQWDYGQKLEITCIGDDLPAFHEVHFSHPGMKEAIVREVESDSTEVAIPDICLEQSSPITAWVYVIDDESKSGTAAKKITLTVEARTRPSVAPDVPEAFRDSYTELITSVSNSIASFESNVAAKLEDGTIRVARAARADFADEAISCVSAEEARLAVRAQYPFEPNAESKGTIDERLNALEEVADFGGYVEEAGHSDQADSLIPGFTKLTKVANVGFRIDVDDDERIYAILFSNETHMTWNVNLIVPQLYDADGYGVLVQGAASRTGEYVECANGLLTFYKADGTVYIPYEAYYRAL